MRTVLLVFALGLYLIRAAASPVVGTWVATDDGRRAATLHVHETDGILGGTVVLYILGDNTNGEHNGDASEPIAMRGVTWDGNTLRFSIDAGGGASAKCAFHLTGANEGRLECGSRVMRVIRTQER